MFDAIARRYDTLNHLLSAGLDRRWRKRAIRELRLSGSERVLDVCTGTADLAIEAATSPSGRAREVVGVDFAGAMLGIGLEKVRRARLGASVRLVRGDATRLPVPDASFDAAMIAFGIRNVVDPAQGARELARALRPGGRLAILEFGMPRRRVLGAAYRWYFRVVLPRIGRLISRHGDAYSYLPASVAEFPSDAAFVQLLEETGFSSVRAVPLALGVVYLYSARRD